MGPKSRFTTTTSKTARSTRPRCCWTVLGKCWVNKIKANSQSQVVSEEDRCIPILFVLTGMQCISDLAKNGTTWPFARKSTLQASLQPLLSARMRYIVSIIAYSYWQADRNLLRVSTAKIESEWVAPRLRTRPESRLDGASALVKRFRIGGRLARIGKRMMERQARPTSAQSLPAHKVTVVVHPCLTFRPDETLAWLRSGSPAASGRPGKAVRAGRM